MKTALEILDLLKELSGLAVDVVRAIDAGEADRVEDILPAKLRTTMAKAISDARAKLKYGAANIP